MKAVPYLFVACALALATVAAHAAPVTTHPRLWIDSADVTRLRTWAVVGNPLWQNGLRQLGVNAAAAMDAGDVPGDDNAGSTYSPVNTEAYAALFAFLANVDPDAAARAQWAQRGRTLFLYIINRVDTCIRASPPSTAGAFCQDSFSVSDRMRWQGASFPLAYDWLLATTLPNGQPALSALDKAAVRRVFIWWCALNMQAYPNPYNNPPDFSLPVGTVGEPLLRQPQDTRRHRIRFSGNNYFAGHMRQLGMMAIAIDPQDDVFDPLAPSTYMARNGNGILQAYPFADANGRLRAYLTHALDGWLYMQDYLLRNDARGGMPPEGMEYAPTSIGIPAQFLYALETAGLADLDAQADHGERVAGLSTNAFYRSMVPGFLHTLSPIAHPNPNRGDVYWPAWYGDGEFYYQGDPISILGPVGLHAARIGDTRTAESVRWMQRHVPPEGSSELLSRARGTEDLLESLMYFMLFDPNAPGSQANAPDPRPQYPSSFWSEGMGRLLARDTWGAYARWFNFKLSWNMVDHQQDDGLMFEFYRDGEWLTKGALGYGLEGGATDYKNTLAVQNTLWSGENTESFMARLLRRGAQMPQTRQSADPSVVARSEDPAFSYVTGDATTLYNAYYEPGNQTPIAQRASDVQHVSRSVLWLKPDHIISYDRARTQTAGRFKRFWLNLPDQLPATPAISVDVATSVTPNGQRLFVSSVLPLAKTLAIVTTDPEINTVRGNLWSMGEEDPILQERQYVNPNTGVPEPGQYENYATRLRIDATGGPTDVRFLTVLQGADAGAVRDAATLVDSVVAAGCNLPASGYQGARFGNRVAMFRRELGSSDQCLQYVVPNSVWEHIVTGLTPDASYTIQRQGEGASQRITISLNGNGQADEGGVLRFSSGALPVPAPRLTVSASEVHLAVVAVGDDRTAVVMLSNRGNALLTISSTALSGPADGSITISGPCTGPGATLAPGADCPVTVRFAPISAGFRESNLTITSNSVDAVAPVVLSGIAEVPSGPLGRVFGDGFE